jgi:integral membrane sensor domain MASE1
VLPNSAAGAWVATFGVAGGIAFAYFLAARLGLALRPEPVRMAVFWPASGIAAGILITAGRRAGLAVVIGVTVGSVTAIILNHRGLLDSTLLGACNLGEVVLFSSLFLRWISGPFAFRNVRGVTGFLTIAGIAAATSGIGGAAILTSSVGLYPAAWQTWFLSHLVGVLVAVPLMVELAQLRREPPRPIETIKAMGVLTLLGLASAYLVMQPTGSWLTFGPNAAVLPLLLWLAARFHPAFAIAGGFLVSSAVICATTFNVGWFGNTAVLLAERVHGAQVSVLTVMVVTLVLVTLFERLRTREEAFRRLLGALPAAIQTTDPIGRITYCNQAAIDMWGTRRSLAKTRGTISIGFIIPTARLCRIMNNPAKSP